jgi:hypothetical protein
MDESKRKLVVLLCMHRSGSSLTANILEKLGMSLGPFDLIGAAPSNPYGHFESIPFHSLNRKIQEWAFGFADDVPDDPEVLARFVESQGAWPEHKPIPPEWFEEAEGIVRTLAESGPVSGFKDPRTVLVWPFWQRVFDSVEGVEVVPVALLRSPHEIAMSLCTRSQGTMPYWSTLDVVGVHLSRMRAIVQESGDAARVVRFGTSAFRSDLESLVAACGLGWDDAIVDRVYDRTCVHHLPAVVPHPAQEALDDLSDGEWADLGATANTVRLAEDARKYEATMHKRLAETQKQVGEAYASLQQNQALLAEAGVIARGLEARAVKAETELAHMEKAFDLMKHCLEQSEKHLARTMESLVSTQERRVSAEQMLAHTQGILAHTEAHVAQVQKSYEHALAQIAAQLNQVQEALDSSQDTGAADRARLAETQDRIVRMQELSIERDDQFRLSLDREQALLLETIDLRKRLERIESHAVLGVALRGRRQIKQIWLKFRHQGPTGNERSTRIDRPV